MSAIRIHFTSADLARTHVMEAPDPRVEMSLSLRALRGESGSRRLSGWRRDLKGRLDHRTRPLMDFVPYGTVLPNFIDPRAAAAERGVRLAAAVSAPYTKVREYLTVMSWSHDVPRSASRFGDGDADTMRELGAAVTAYYDAAIEPYWHDVRSIVDSDRAVRGRSLLDGGIERVFRTLHHTVTWQPPVLRLALSNGFDADLYLDGRGLRLQPSVFAGSRAALWDFSVEDEALTLVYPATSDGRSPARAGQPSLIALIGRSRAQLLTAIADRPGRTSGDLARELRISPASASEHATVLRNAGLITTIRYRKSALHTLTPLGAIMLDPSTALTQPAPVD
jgi:DNA-binding transcriptional ArsR family regulator